MADNFRASDFALKVQKNIVSRMSTKGVAKVFIDEKMGSLLDNVYRLCKTYCKNKKEAEKIVKNTIKIISKIQLLAKNNSSLKKKLGRPLNSNLNSTKQRKLLFLSTKLTSAMTRNSYPSFW